MRKLELINRGRNFSKQIEKLAIKKREIDRLIRELKSTGPINHNSGRIIDNQNKYKRSNNERSIAFSTTGDSNNSLYEQVNREDSDRRENEFNANENSDNDTVFSRGLRSILRDSNMEIDQSANIQETEKNEDEWEIVESSRNRNRKVAQRDRTVDTNRGSPSSYNDNFRKRSVNR